MSQAPSIQQYPMARQQRRALRSGLLLTLALAGVLTHAALSRAERRRERHPEVRVLPSASLVLSTRSRWLRHPFDNGPVLRGSGNQVEILVGFTF